jgi:hypothetical protein
VLGSPADGAGACDAGPWDAGVCAVHAEMASSVAINNVMGRFLVSIAPPR